MNDLEEQARWLREECHGIDSWHPMSLEEDRLPYPLWNVLSLTRDSCGRGVGGWLGRSAVITLLLL